MKVEVRLFAGLRAGRFKKRLMELPERATVADALRHIDILPEEVSLPLINGRYSEMDDGLSSGDVLSVFPAVGGG